MERKKKDNTQLQIWNSIYCIPNTTLSICLTYMLNNDQLDICGSRNRENLWSNERELQGKQKQITHHHTLADTTGASAKSCVQKISKAADRHLKNQQVNIRSAPGKKPALKQPEILCESRKQFLCSLKLSAMVSKSITFANHYQGTVGTDIQ